MSTIATLSALLLLTPPEPPPTPIFRPSRSEVTTTEEGVEIRSYDTQGTVVGVLALYVDLEGDLHITVEFDDGWTDVERFADGTYTVDSSLDADTVNRRTQVMADSLQAPGGGPLAVRGATKCALGIVPAIGLCQPGAWGLVVTCPGAVLIAICACRDVIKELLDFDFTVCEE